MTLHHGQFYKIATLPASQIIDNFPEMTLWPRKTWRKGCRYVSSEKNKAQPETTALDFYPSAGGCWKRKWPFM